MCCPKPHINYENKIKLHSTYSACANMEIECSWYVQFYLHNSNGTTIQCHGKCVSTAALLLAYRKDENYLDCHNSYAMHTFSNLFVSVILHTFWCVEYLLWAPLTVSIHSEKWFIRNPKSVTCLGRLQLHFCDFLLYQGHQISWISRATLQKITGHTSQFY